jgi:TonB family protein
MSKFEKLGPFLLFDKVEEDKISKNFVAGQINNNQIQAIHWVQKFDHSLSTMPDFILDMNQELEILKALSNPALIRPGDIVKDKSEFAAIFDYFEGKSLRSVLQKCSQEGYPFTADHALLIASRVCAALEYLHSKKVKDQRLIHGYIGPESVFITYDGETKVQYLGLAPLLLKNPITRDRFLQTHKNHLAPEVFQTYRLDKASDVFGTGALLYEMLAGEALFAKGRDINIQQTIDHATMHNQSGDKVPLPDDVKKALHQSLSPDPAQRFSTISDFRKLLDQQLFTSDYSPTTFNLAFFMNSLFRENMDQEGKNIKNYKKLDVATYVKEEPAPAKTEHPVGAEAAKDMPVAAIPMTPPRHHQAAVPAFGREEDISTVSEKSSKTPLFIGILIAVAVIGVGAYFFLKPDSTAPPKQTATLTPEQIKLRDAERIKLEKEAQLAQDEAKKKDEQLKELQAKLDQLLKAQKDPKATATTTPADTAAIQQLQEQAKKLEEERKRQEALAAEKLRAAAAPPPVEPEQAEPKPAETKAETIAAQNPPPVQNQPSQEQPTKTEPVQKQETAVIPQPQPAVAKPIEAPAPTFKEGDVVEMAPDVVKPELLNRVQPSYPPIALRQKVEGTVILSLLVSDGGEVSDIKILREAGGSAGLTEAAVAAAKQWKFRPAVKQGKRVKVWVTYPVTFKLQQ